MKNIKGQTMFCCEDCRMYELCNYYHNRRGKSNICENFTLFPETERERQKYFAYLDGVADGLNETRNDVNLVLNKIRADVINIADGRRSMSVRSVIKILDKYKAESEGAK